ncbi:MAG: hypothetical protein L0Z53_25375 [Acidobacteriales bacterium]|nr:hypothetical protein [Terriglobales bacterium]
MNGEFYIGYLPKAPAGLARFVKHTVVTLAVSVIALAVLLVVAQNPFAASVFEFGKNSTFEGTIRAHPYPTLLVARPAGSSQDASFSRYLLVAPGKHGADQLVAPFDGQHVKLEGQLIYRDANTMIEVVPGSISPLERTEPTIASAEDLGEATLTGEIVDTKCYLGVMNPGSGKVHRECAARCISGRVPAGFVVRDTAKVYLLTDTAGRPLDRSMIRVVGEPLTIRGRILKSGETLFLATTAGGLHSKARGL